ncbi:hypothetical protein QM467_07130 [Rhodoblastus sp. 17X3]|nr:hypothetical protein [Rhodoblastus sp. 17X3]MDI9847825.1 hypothetical protein [Rhodoblastus sp. 17X3]
MPRVLTGLHDSAQDKWELYNAAKDFSQAHDLADKDRHVDFD